jgi:hypothetical protein
VNLTSPLHPQQMLQMCLATNLVTVCALTACTETLLFYVFINVWEFLPFLGQVMSRLVTMRLDKRMINMRSR